MSARECRCPEVVVFNGRRYPRVLDPSCPVHGLPEGMQSFPPMDAHRARVDDGTAFGRLETHAEAQQRLYREAMEEGS